MLRDTCWVSGNKGSPDTGDKFQAPTASLHRLNSTEMKNKGHKLRGNSSECVSANEIYGCCRITRQGLETLFVESRIMVLQQCLLGKPKCKHNSLQGFKRNLIFLSTTQKFFGVGRGSGRVFTCRKQFKLLEKLSLLQMALLGKAKIAKTFF